MDNLLTCWCQYSWRKCLEIFISWQLSVYQFSCRICFPDFFHVEVGDVGLEQLQSSMAAPPESMKPTAHYTINALGLLGLWACFSAPTGPAVPPVFADLCIQGFVSPALCLGVLPRCHTHFLTVLKVLMAIHQFTVFK